MQGTSLSLVMSRLIFATRILSSSISVWLKCAGRLSRMKEIWEGAICARLKSYVAPLRLPWRQKNMAPRTWRYWHGSGGSSFGEGKVVVLKERATQAINALRMTWFTTLGDFMWWSPWMIILILCSYKIYSSIEQMNVQTKKREVSEAYQDLNYESSNYKWNVLAHHIWTESILLSGTTFQGLEHVQYYGRCTRWIMVLATGGHVSMFQEDSPSPPR